MGDRRLNGIDAAIALLRALTESGGELTCRAAAQRTGLSRSSLHRIATKLSAHGIVRRSRGRIHVGDVARAFITADCARLRVDCQMRAARAHAAGIRAIDIQDDMNTPLTLSRPALNSRPAKRLHIGFANASLDNPWRVALVHSVEHAASSFADVIARFDVRDADNNAQQQAADIQELAGNGVDGLIVSAIESPVVSSAVTTARQAGVEVVMVDRRLPQSEPTSFVTTSDAAIGRKTAQWLVSVLGGKGSLLLLPGARAAEPAQIRFSAAQKVFAGYPQIKIVGVDWTGWQRQGGYNATTRALAETNGDINGVWCDSGLQGVGSMEAFLAAGFTTGAIPPHTGGDLNLAYKLAIRHQVKLGAMDYPPAMGFRAVEVLIAAMRGSYVPKRQTIATDLVLTRNAAVADMTPQIWAEDHVRWDLPDELVLASSLGWSYNPRSFRIHYPGNSYNRSAARLSGSVS